MENKNNLTTIFLIVFMLSTVVLGGYVAYDKLTVKEDEEVKEPPKDEQPSYTLAKRKKVQSIRGDLDKIEVLVDLEGNAYIYTVVNTDTIEDATEKENLKKLESQYKTYSPKGYSSPDGTSLNAYKLDIKALNVTRVYSGNAGYAYYIFLLEDGTLSYFSYEAILREGRVSFKNIEGIENVSYVVENSYDWLPYAVTKDGNEVDLYQKLK